MKITFICNTTVGVGFPVYTKTDLSSNTHCFTWNTQFGCSVPNSGGMEGGWVFVIIVVCFSATYLILGVLIKKIRFDARGSDLFPNRDFWANLPGLIADGMRFLFCCRRSPRSYWKSLPFKTTHFFCFCISLCEILKLRKIKKRFSVGSTTKSFRKSCFCWKQ